MRVNFLFNVSDKSTCGPEKIYYKLFSNNLKGNNFSFLLKQVFSSLQLTVVSQIQVPIKQKLEINVVHVSAADIVSLLIKTLDDVIKVIIYLYLLTSHLENTQISCIDFNDRLMLSELVLKAFRAR